MLSFKETCFLCGSVRGERILQNPNGKVSLTIMLEIREYS